jgi:hypothetical protein
MEKKTWVAPELVVVTRALPEESILLGCKTSQITGPVTIGFGCFCGDQICRPCSNLADS